MITEVELQIKRTDHEMDRRDARENRRRNYVIGRGTRNKARRNLVESYTRRKMAIAHAVRATQSVKKTNFFADISKRMFGLVRSFGRS